MKFSKLIFRDLTTFGSLVFFVFVIVITSLFGKEALFIDLLIGLVLMSLLIVVIRTIYFKERPHKQEFNNFIEKIDASSFPSLHTSRVVFLMLILQEYSSNNLVTGLLVIFTSLIAYSRVFLKKHDWKDLLGGAIIGGISYFIILQI
jgi:undecaprenyl-diphosphatase